MVCKRFFFLHFHEKIRVKYLVNAYFPFFSHRSISCTTVFVSLNYGVGVNLRNRITEVTPFIAFLLLQIQWKTRKNILPKIDYRFFLYLFAPFSGCQTPIHFTKPMNVFKRFPAKKCNFFSISFTVLVFHIANTSFHSLEMHTGANWREIEGADSKCTRT